ncbi:multicopper oxidase protein [Rutstroemia sp. NJR-2017a WRK4]|nr:multicopper oxidase protein [Rutstroemia sp. NJR-2017a WRK4]
MAPDGTPRWMLVINGSYPGPTITANWGDTLEITVVNEMENDGVSMHWHGIYQKNTNAMDGDSVNGVTECPIPPRSSKTYKFVATQHGTSWYHSHHAAQYGDGILGSVVINGPAALDYDYDLGPMPITDFYYQSSYEAGLMSVKNGPPDADNGLLNGTNMNLGETTGYYNNVTALVPGAKYRLRLINMSVDNHFRVTLDNHEFAVIATDFVAIQPYTTRSLFIAIGQRYDVIIRMDQKMDNYWFRAIIPKPPTTEATGCGENLNNGSIKAIFNYQGASIAHPKSESYDLPQSCLDETDLVPWNEKAVPEEKFIWPIAQEMIVTGPGSHTNPPAPAPFTWSINNTFMKVEWDNPTLQFVQQGNTSYNPHQSIIELSGAANSWTFWIIVNAAPIPHPIHLHGHDFHILGQKAHCNFTDKSELNFANPPRRDVAMLPAAGYLVIGFVLDNPGAWLLHCHIAWHVGEGLALQFLERKSDILTQVDLSPVAPGCDAWNNWFEHERTHEPWNVEFDSGI